MTSGSSEIIIFDPKEVLGILDLRLIGYYQIKQGILQQNLSQYYTFKSADILCKQLNKFIKYNKRGENIRNARKILMDRIR